MYIAPSKSRKRAKIRNLGVSETRDHIQIKIKMLNPSQEPPAPNKAPNQDLKDMGVLCTFKIKTGSQSSEHGCSKDQWKYPNKDQDDKPHLGPSNFLQCPNQDSNDKFMVNHLWMPMFWFGRNLGKVSVLLPCENPFLFKIMFFLISILQMRTQQMQYSDWISTDLIQS